MGDKQYKFESTNLHDPANEGELAVLDVDFTLGITRAIYIGNSGDVAVEFKSGNTEIFRNAISGTILPIRITQVLTVGTSANNIIGLF